MAGNMLKSLVLIGLTGGLLAACQTTTGDGAITGAPLAEVDGVAPAVSMRLVDRDVEAPQDFQTTDLALWDGRPSIGGVWVAAANVTDPMRVILRNPANGKFVIGALFRREAENPGPPLQISSDAADALGMTAGEPVTLSVTALRREEVAAPEPDAAQPLLDSAETVEGAEDLADDATAAIQASPLKPRAKPGAQPVAEVEALPEVVPDPEPVVATGPGKLIQIGIFSVEANAKRAVDALAKAGITATISQETSHGKQLWSVTARGDKGLLGKIRAAGFADAYFL
jgi:cell division septation protein DedD